MVKIQNILIIFLIALAAIFFIFNDEITDLLKLKLQDQKQSYYNSVNSPTLVTGIFVGDIMLSRNVDAQMKKNNSYAYPFLNVSDLLQKNDFVFANLEAPIINGRTIKDGEMVFRVDEDILPTLKQMNFSVFSLANNHIFNFGEKGFLNTLNLLDKFNIQYPGAGKNFAEAHQPKIIERNNIKFAFLAYNDVDLTVPIAKATENHCGIAIMDNLVQLQQDVANAKKMANFVIVSMHAGDEFQYEPEQYKIDFAHAAIDAGADLVIGHHPHVLQSIEKYKNGYIFYSLGNFVFDQMWSNETRESMALRIIFSPKTIKAIQIYPIFIENSGQPKIINASNSPEHYQNIIQKINLVDKKIKIIQ